MSTLEVKELSHPSGEVIKIASGKTLDLKSQGTTTLPTGSVLQVVSATLKSAVAISSNETNTYVASGLTATITPSSTSSKILVSVNMFYGFGPSGTMHFRLARGTDSTICIGDTGLSNQLRDTAAVRTNGTPYVLEMNSIPMQHLDSPSTTSATTYSVMITMGASYNTNMYVNRTHSADNGNYNPRGTSTITLTEIQG
jgi:hypothetical protein